MRALFLFLPLLAGACGVLGPRECTTIAMPAIVVEVLDEVSGSRVRGPIVVFARDGSYADSTTGPWRFDEGARHVPPVDPDTMYWGPFSLAHGRSGRYAVEVRAPGYQTWERKGVRVAHDGCHPRTIELQVRLGR